MQCIWPSYVSARAAGLPCMDVPSRRSTVQDADVALFWVLQLAFTMTGVGREEVGDDLGCARSDARGPGRKIFSPVRLALYCGLCGAVGSSLGWFLWVAVPQFPHHLSAILESVAIGCVIGLISEAARYYFEVARTKEGEEKDKPHRSRLRAALLVTPPLLALIVQLGAENAFSTLVAAVSGPLVLSMAKFFLLGALLGFVFSGQLSHALPANGIDKYGDPESPLLVRATIGAYALLYLEMLFIVIVIVLVIWPMHAWLGLPLSPGQAVGDSVWYIIIVVVIFTVSACTATRSLVEALSLWAGMTCIVFATVALPLYGSVETLAGEVPQAGTATFLVPVAKGLLQSPDTEASTWKEAEAELSRSLRPGPATVMPGESLDLYLYRLIGCDHPARSTASPEGRKTTVSAAQQDAQLKLQACDLLSLKSNPGITNSAYVVALFILGIVLAPRLEYRMQPVKYLAHPLRKVDRVTLLVLSTVSLVVLVIM
jgi:hypothetical protein